MREYVAKHAHRAVVPSTHMLRYWWARINAAAFDGLLLPCQLTYGPHAGEVDGMCYPLDLGRVRIHVDARIKTRGGMLSTLAHEMIHQWQHQHDLDMTHGDVFKGWAEVVRIKTGLTT